MQEHKINMGVAVIKSGKRREASSCFSKLKAQTPAAVYAGVGEGHRKDAWSKSRSLASTTDPLGLTVGGEFTESTFAQAF